MFTAGQAVEVYAVWSYCGAKRAPDYAWFGGYAFVSEERGVTRVRHTGGLFEGLEINVDAANVRPEPPRVTLRLAGRDETFRSAEQAARRLRAAGYSAAQIGELLAG